MQDHKLTTKEYQKLKEVDIREIDPSTVPDIQDIHVDISLSPSERLLDVIFQMKGNPFVYRCGNILVKTSFTGTRPLQAVLEDCLEHSK